MERERILEMLLLCNYYLTYRCNAHCSFCHFGNHDSLGTAYASLNDFERNVTELAKAGVKFIDLTGGEPLLHKDIHHFAKYARGLKMQTSITTNTLLYSKYAERLAGNVNLLHFSLDSPDEEEHDNIRGVKCFQKVLESIKIAKSLGEFPDILFTVTETTYQKLPRMYELSYKFGLVLLVNPVFSYFGNPGLSDKAIEYIGEYTSGKFNIYLNNAFLKVRKDGGNKKNNPLCKAVSRTVVISPSNEIILPCYHFGINTIPIDRPIEVIRQSPDFKYYKHMEGRFDFCEGCTINCYLEPSFAFPTNRYSFVSLPSKLKYSFNKLVIQKIKKTFNHNE